jgi:hypothetical protein
MLESTCVRSRLPRTGFRRLLHLLTGITEVDFASGATALGSVMNMSLCTQLSDDAGLLLFINLTHYPKLSHV